MKTDQISAHTFHIPVMGTSFTIDSPLKVARYGITSVVSLVDDILIEKMRKFYCLKEGEPYVEIPREDIDHRSKRITAYLNLMQMLLDRQVAALKASPFEPGSEITRYYDLLPECPQKDKYRKMLSATDPALRKTMEAQLRDEAVPGKIDVNIMTKVDSERYRDGEKLPQEYCDALTAFKGFAESSLSSSIVLSAGMNPRLYGYINNFKDFLPDQNGNLKKKIILKVSDYRSAEIQGKYLAKRGLWVSEYRIESGLNCGGHAFATTGYLMGPILDELKVNRQQLHESIYALYSKSVEKMGHKPADKPYGMRITVQGGIGTSGENELLLKYYELDATGWGTPFMLVPEATSIDAESLGLLAAATDKEVFLSESSPFGIPFWNLRSSPSERERQRKVDAGEPGTSCPKGFLKTNTEFTKVAICTASSAYLRQKLDNITKEGLTDEQIKVVKAGVEAKACLCEDLAGTALVHYGIEPGAKACLCSGPNIVNFDRTYTLEEMVGHIYGRLQLITRKDRPHMFIRELMLYVDYLKSELNKHSLKLSARTPKYFDEFRTNLLNGIENYQGLAEKFITEHREQFVSELARLKREIESLPLSNLA